MSRYDADLRVVGEHGQPLHVVVDIDEERLSLHTADTEIGSWARSEVRINALNDGFHIRVEGDEIVLDLGDEVDADFALAAGLRAGPPLLRRKMSARLRSQ